MERFSPAAAPPPTPPPPRGCPHPNPPPQAREGAESAALGEKHFLPDGRDVDRSRLAALYRSLSRLRGEGALSLPLPLAREGWGGGATSGGVSRRSPGRRGA